MFGRKRSLLSKKEVSNLWGFWWSSTANCARILSNTADRPDAGTWMAFGAVTCDMIDEFYDSIAWLETL